jgi:hypothetical protein
VGNPQGKRPLGRPRRKWENNIVMDLRERGWRGVDWIGLAKDKGPVECYCEHGIEPSGSIEYWAIVEQLRDCRLL